MTGSKSGSYGRQNGARAFLACVGAWLREGAVAAAAALPPPLPPPSPPRSARDGQKAKEEQRSSQSTDTEQPRVVGGALHAEQEPTAQRAEGRQHLTVR